MDVINGMKAQLKRLSASNFSSLLQKHKGCSNELLTRELFELCTPTADPIPGDYNRDKLLVGVVNSALQFGLVKGLSHMELYHFIYLCLDVLTLFIAKPSGSPTLSELVLDFKALLDTQRAMFSEGSLLKAVEYLSTTMLHHFHLYQYMLCEQQMTDMTILRLDIQTPALPLPLQTGITEGEGLRREKLKELEVSHAKMKEDLIRTEEQELHVDQHECNTDAKLSEAQLEEAINELAKAHIQRVRGGLLRDITHHELDLRFHVGRAEILLSDLPHCLPPKSPRDTKTPQTN